MGKRFVFTIIFGVCVWGHACAGDRPWPVPETFLGRPVAASAYGRYEQVVPLSQFIQCLYSWDPSNAGAMSDFLCELTLCADRVQSVTEVGATALVSAIDRTLEVCLSAENEGRPIALSKELIGLLLSVLSKIALSDSVVQSKVLICFTMKCKTILSTGELALAVRRDCINRTSCLCYSFLENMVERTEKFKKYYAAGVCIHQSERELVRISLLAVDWLTSLWAAKGCPVDNLLSFKGRLLDCQNSILLPERKDYETAETRN